MNKTRTIKVEKIIDVDIKKVKDILLDLNNYPKWWKKYHLKYDSKNAIICFRPISFVNLKLKLLDQGDYFILFQYVEGPLHGFGIWEFKELENGKTSISNTISISGKNRLIALLIATPFFNWKHKKDIGSLMRLIESY